MFGIHRSSYKYWRQPKKLDATRVTLLSLVREVYRESNGSAGARSIAAMVTTKGIKLSLWRATKLMQALNIISCQKPGHRYKKANIEIPNHLDRQFAVTKPNQVWCGDVTYIWTGKSWAYLAVVLDFFPVNRLAGRCHFSLIQHSQLKPCRWPRKHGENRLIYCITRIKAVTIPAGISGSYCGDIR